MNISVVIRNKNEAESLEFLLEVLQNKYREDIAEVIVIDNLSSDSSEEICDRFNAKFISVKNFSYGGSANIAAEEASHEIVVIFSAHSYPVSHDFFKIIKAKFLNSDGKLAGLRCIHNNADYRIYLKDISSYESPNSGGLIFSGSAFSRDIWKKHWFNHNVQTFEDKEWSMRMLEMGYSIQVVPSIFSYYVKRSQKQLFFRFKNDTIGGYQIFDEKPSVKSACIKFTLFFVKGLPELFLAIYYNFRRLSFIVFLRIRGIHKYKLRRLIE